MRCKACNEPISVRDSKLSPGSFEDLCLKCRRSSKIESDYEKTESDKDVQDLLLMLFGDSRKKRSSDD